MKHENLTEKIIGCAYTVYNKTGFGFLESVYLKCLLIELKKAGLNASSEIAINVFYDKVCVGSFFADILVENTVILELKSVRSIVKAHEVQLVHYLKATGIPTGLILNFSESGVEVKRKALCLDKKAFSPDPVNPVDPVKTVL